MRVTLDTNVLVSAFISKHGTPADILDLIATFEEITLALSDEILVEFVDVMSRKEVQMSLGYNKSDISKLENAIRNIAEIIVVKSDYKAIKEDPEDDIVVNTAIDGKAQYIVSGDRHLWRLGEFMGEQIVNPKIFLSIVTKSFGDLIISDSNSELE